MPAAHICDEQGPDGDFSPAGPCPRSLSGGCHSLELRGPLTLSWRIVSPLEPGPPTSQIPAPSFGDDKAHLPQVVTGNDNSEVAPNFTPRLPDLRVLLRMSVGWRVLVPSVPSPTAHLAVAFLPHSGHHFLLLLGTMLPVCFQYLRRPCCVYNPVSLT